MNQEFDPLKLETYAISSLQFESILSVITITPLLQLNTVFEKGYLTLYR